MPEVRRVYSLSNLDLNELNSIFAQLADRLDQLEGYRGIPTFLAPPVSGASASSSSQLPLFSQLSAIQSALQEIYPPTYGEMYISSASGESLSLTNQSTWYQMVNFSAGHLDNVTFDGTYDHMVLPVGRYLVQVWIGGGVTGTNQDLTFAAAIDGTILTDHQTMQRFFTSDLMSISLGGVEAITEGQKLTVHVKNDTSAGQTFVTYKCTVLAIRLHVE